MGTNKQCYLLVIHAGDHKIITNSIYQSNRYNVVWNGDTDSEEATPTTYKQNYYMPKTPPIVIEHDQYGFPLNIQYIYRFPKGVCLAGQDAVIRHAKKLYPEIFL